MTTDMLTAPVGKLLIIDDDMALCCCQRLLTQYNANKFICRNNRITIPGGESGLESCPICGARNILLYDGDTPREDPRTCRNELEDYIVSTTARMNGVRTAGNEHLSATGGKVDTVAGSMGALYHGINQKIGIVKDAIALLDDYLGENSDN